MGKITFKNEFDFLSSQHKKREEICENIKQFFKDNFSPIGEPLNGSKHLRIVQFKDMENWDVTNLNSPTLNALAQKIYHMIWNIGSPGSVPEMLKKIATGRIKKLRKPPGKNTHHYFKTENLGLGHFRWNYRAYQLNSRELEVVNKLVTNLSL